MMKEQVFRGTDGAIYKVIQENDRVTSGRKEFLGERSNGAWVRKNFANGWARGTVATGGP